GRVGAGFAAAPAPAVPVTAGGAAGTAGGTTETLAMILGTRTAVKPSITAGFSEGNSRTLDRGFAKESGRCFATSPKMDLAKPDMSGLAAAAVGAGVAGAAGAAG